MIKHDHPTYVYVQLADLLRDRILTGDLSRQRRLPRQDAIAKEYQVAEWTVRRAIGVLRDEGIVTVSGRGTFGPGVRTVAMESRAELGRALAALRSVRGLTRSDLAGLVGETDSWVARNEAGTRRVDPVELARIARALEVGLDEILDRANIDHRPRNGQRGGSAR